MPFDRETKRRMFERCLRLCCLCLEPSGTKIYAAHIIDESANGPNTEDNGIPVCHDCHHEIGHYRTSHPLGNKYQPQELRNRRDRVYQLVDSGAMYAMLIAARVRAGGGTTLGEVSLVPPKPSSEAVELLNRIMAGDLDASRGGKLKMLDLDSRSVLLDHLIQNAERGTVTDSLMLIAASPLLTDDERAVIVERTTRRVTLFGNSYAKAALLKSVSPQLFSAMPPDVRAAFFEDVIACIEADQFDPVNELVPPLEQHLAAVPAELYPRFVQSLLGQAGSSSWNGAPAAQRMLKNLPQAMATAGIAALNLQFLCWYGHRDEVRAFVDQYHGLAPNELRAILRDYRGSSRRDFLARYAPDEN